MPRPRTPAGASEESLERGLQFCHRSMDGGPDVWCVHGYHERLAAGGVRLQYAALVEQAELMAVDVAEMKVHAGQPVLVSSEGPVCFVLYEGNHPVIDSDSCVAVHEDLHLPSRTAAIGNTGGTSLHEDSRFARVDFFSSADRAKRIDTPAHSRRNLPD